MVAKATKPCDTNKVASDNERTVIVLPDIKIEEVVKAKSDSPEDQAAAEAARDIIKTETQRLESIALKLKVAPGQPEPIERSFTLISNAIDSGHVNVRFSAATGFDRDAATRLLMQFEARVRVAVAARSRVEAAPAA